MDGGRQLREQGEACSVTLDAGPNVKVLTEGTRAEEVAATKALLGTDPAKSFFIEENVLAHTRQLVERGAAAHKAWDEKFEAWAKANPERAELYKRLVAGELPADYKAAFPVFEAGTSVATRAASGTVINAIADTFPELWGGSADLAGSNLTTIKGAEAFNPASRSTEDWTANPYGRVLHFGIREQAAAATVNGIVLSSPTRAFSGTFFVFSDYQRPAARLSPPHAPSRFSVFIKSRSLCAPPPKPGDPRAVRMLEGHARSAKRRQSSLCVTAKTVLKPS